MLFFLTVDRYNRNQGNDVSAPPPSIPVTPTPVSYKEIPGSGRVQLTGVGVSVVYSDVSLKSVARYLVGEWSSSGACFITVALFTPLFYIFLVQK